MWRLNDYFHAILRVVPHAASALTAVIQARPGVGLCYWCPTRNPPGSYTSFQQMCPIDQRARLFLLPCSQTRSGSVKGKLSTGNASGRNSRQRPGDEAFNGEPRASGPGRPTLCVGLELTKAYLIWDCGMVETHRVNASESLWHNSLFCCFLKS